MIEFIIGRRKSGKSTYLIKKIQSCIQNKEGCILLVPEQSTLENEEEMIRVLGSQGLLDVQVLGFNKLSNLYLKKTPLRNKQILKEKGQLLVLNRAISSLDLKVFNKPKAGIVKELLKVIGYLQEVDQDRLNQADFKSQPHLMEKIQDILTIKKSYEDFIHNDYVDQNNLYDELEMAIKKDQVVSTLHIFVDDFYRFSKKQLRVLFTLMKFAKSFSLAIDADSRDPSLFAPSLSILEDLKAFAQAEGLAFEVTEMKDQWYENTNIALLDNHLSKNRRGVFPDTVDGLVIRRVTNYDLEIKKLFESILRLYDQGIQYNEMKIVCNNLDAYRNYFKFYRRLYGVPLFINEKVKVHNHPLSRLVLGFIRLTEKNYTDFIVDILKTGYLDFSPEEIETLEAYVLENGIHYNKWNKVIGGEAFIEVEESRIKVLDLISDYRKTLDKTNLKTRIASMYQFLTKIKVYESIKEKTEQFKEKGNYNSVYINTQIWNVLLDTLDQLVAFLGDQSLSEEDLYWLLRNSLERENISILPVKSNEVLVISSEDAFKEKAVAVFLIGVNEGHFPEVIGEDLLFPLKENESLEQAYGWKQDKSSRQEIKNLENYFALTIANKYLYLSYSMSDGEGGSLNPSYLISQLEKFGTSKGGTEENSLKIQDAFHEDTGYFYSPEVSLTHLIQEAFQSNSNPEGVAFSKSIWSGVKEQFKDLLEELRLYDKEEVQDGLVAASIVREAFYKNDLPYFSISKLEGYGRCPYHFFLSYAIRPKEEQDYEIPAMEYGNIFHNVLYHAGRAGYLATANAHEKELTALFETEYEAKGFEKYDTMAQTYYKEKAIREGVELVAYLNKEAEESHFTPVAFELEFGPGKEVSEYTLQGEDGTEIFMDGKIDRVDLLQEQEVTYLRVLDYKLRNKSIDLSKIKDGISFQLFLYLNTLQKDKHKKFGEKTNPAGLFYAPCISQDGPRMMSSLVVENPSFFHDKSPYVKNKGLPIEDFDALAQGMDETILQHARKILKGDFKPYPYFYGTTNKGCLYCSYGNICRISQRKTFRRLKTINTKKSEKVQGGDRYGVDE